MPAVRAAAEAADLPQGFLEELDRRVGPRGWTVDADQLALHAAEQWGAWRGRAAVLVRPADTGEVAALLELCHARDVPVVPQGGNTGLVGAGVPDGSGRMAVLSLGRLFPLSLGAQGSCQIGGNIASNAGGVNVLRYGMARSLVLGLEVVLADGRIWDGLRSLRKDNTGYDLKQLFIGAEGTLGVITAAVLRLVPRPHERQTAWLGIAPPEAAVALLALFRERLGETVGAFQLMAGPAVELVLRYLPDARLPLPEPAPWYVLAEVA